ncbi:MAG: hypothetical protein AB7F75_12930 [Planctomycetota bacterium]
MYDDLLALTAFYVNADHPPCVWCGREFEDAEDAYRDDAGVVCCSRRCHRQRNCPEFARRRAETAARLAKYEATKTK